MRFTICVVLLCSSYGLIAQSKFHFTSSVKTINNFRLEVQDYYCPINHTQLDKVTGAQIFSDTLLFRHFASQNCFAYALRKFLAVSNLPDSAALTEHSRISGKDLLELALNYTEISKQEASNTLKPVLLVFLDANKQPLHAACMHNSTIYTKNGGLPPAMAKDTAALVKTYSNTALIQYFKIEPDLQ